MVGNGAAAFQAACPAGHPSHSRRLTSHFRDRIELTDLEVKQIGLRDISLLC